MKYPIIFRSQAKKEIETAYQWYEERRNGLGEDFLLCVEEVIEKISRSPHLYPTVYKNICRALVRRFPYSIFYIKHEDRIIILAVFHEKRDPKEWQKRT